MTFKKDAGMANRKKILNSLFVGVFITISLFSICSVAESADWKPFASGNLSGVIHYDAESLRKTLVGYQTQMKIFDNKKDVIQTRQMMGLSVKGYDNYSHTIIFMGINCSENQYYISHTADYDVNGKTLSSGYVGKKKAGTKPWKNYYSIEWKQITPGSGMDDFKKAFCK